MDEGSTAELGDDRALPGRTMQRPCAGGGGGGGATGAFLPQPAAKRSDNQERLATPAAQRKVLVKVSFHNGRDINTT